MILESGSQANSTDTAALGRHILLEMYDCTPSLLTDKVALEDALVQSAKDGGATVVETVFHQFSPHGLSGVVVIAESHITIHTWPEYNYAALDVFTCGNPQIAENIKDCLIKAFAAKSVSTKSIQRGLNLPADFKAQ